MKIDEMADQVMGKIDDASTWECHKIIKQFASAVVREVRLKGKVIALCRPELEIERMRGYNEAVKEQNDNARSLGLEVTE